MTTYMDAKKSILAHHSTDLSKREFELESRLHEFAYDSVDETLILMFFARKLLNKNLCQRELLLTFT